MKNWKKQWKTELDSVTPSLSQSVKDEPICLPETSTPVNACKKRKVQIKRAFVTACAAIAITVVVALSGVLLPLLNRGDGDGETYPAIVTVEINPKATFLLNEDGLVKEVIAMNSSADIILSNKTRVNTIEGKPIEKAIEEFVNYSAMLGFVSLSDEDAIRLSHTGTWDGDWNTAINDTLKNYFKSNKLKVAVLNEEVSFNEFCLRTGVSGLGNLTEVADWVTSATTLYAGRGLSSLTQTELVQTYSENVLKAVGVTELSSTLSSIISDVELCQSAIGYAIMVGDYSKVNSVRSQFNLKYGTNFKGLDDMLAFFELTDYYMQGIVESLNAVNSAEDFASVLEDVEELFPLDITNYKNIAVLPQDMSEFIKKQETAFNISYNKKVSDNRAEYTSVREDFDYDAWLDGFISNDGFSSVW